MVRYFEGVWSHNFEIHFCHVHEFFQIYDHLCLYFIIQQDHMRYYLSTVYRIWCTYWRIIRTSITRIMSRFSSSKSNNLLIVHYRHFISFSCLFETFFHSCKWNWEGSIGIFWSDTLVIALSFIDTFRMLWSKKYLIVRIFTNFANRPFLWEINFPLILPICQNNFPQIIIILSICVYNVIITFTFYIC